jgi:uncharacterized protein
MIIAVMSDSHDHIDNIRNALTIAKNEKAEMIIHCGDFVAPFMLKELDAAGIPVHGVFGNNDGDQYLLTRMSILDLSHITIHGIIGAVDADGLHIQFTHDQRIAQGLAASGSHDLVCFGHTHTYTKKMINETILLNPGEIMGKDGSPGYCLVNSKTSEIVRINL